MGIGAGSLAADVPDKKHMAFFAYGLALIFGGIFGLDSFLVGDKQSGFIRLISLITVIFAPIAMFWWGLNLVKFFAKTKDVVEENWEYFGAPQPASEKAPLVAQFISKIPIVNKLFGSTLAGIVGNKAATILTQAATPAAGVLEGATAAFEQGAKTVDDIALAAGKTANAFGAAATAAGEVAKTGTAALGLAGQAATLSEGVTAQALESALQKGGAANNDMLSYTLIGTFALLAVSGLVLTYRRLRQNEQPRKDDAPPEPGVLRKPNQEKPAEAP
jgi:TM2 domain-containing membrane protein YozV